MEKQYLKYIGAIVGAIIGFFYWSNYSCDQGCAITSKWWATMILFALIGYQLTDFIHSFVNKKATKEE